MNRVSKIFSLLSIFFVFSSQSSFAFEVKPLPGGQQASGQLQGGEQKSSKKSSSGNATQKEELELASWDKPGDAGFMYKYSNFMFGFQGGFGNQGDASVSGDFSSTTKTAFEDRQSNRVLMGLSIDSGLSLYGFAGLSESFLSNYSDYYDASQVQGSSCQYDRKRRRNYCSSFTATKEAMGYAEDKGWYDGHILGAGMQYGLFGGTLRLEYTYSDFGVISDRMKVTYRVNDTRVQANGPGYKDVSWNTEEHNAYVRWDFNF